jgi:hypothetical protein
MSSSLFVQLLVNGIIVGMLYGIVAMCFVLIYKSTQVVNFAQGEFVVLGAWVCLSLVVSMGLPFWLAFIFTLVFMTIFGVVVQVLLLRPLVGVVLASVSVDLESRRIGKDPDTITYGDVDLIAENLSEQLRLLLGKDVAEAAARKVRALM